MTLRSLAICLQSIHMHPTGVEATGNERLRYYIQINDAYVVGCTIESLLYDHPQNHIDVVV